LSTNPTAGRTRREPAAVQPAVKAASEPAAARTPLALCAENLPFDIRICASQHRAGLSEMQNQFSRVQR